MPTQYGEDARILEYFTGRPRGRFLDIGAGDGITFSNTLPLLDELKWSGVMVEPCPSMLRWLYGNHLPGLGVQIVPHALGGGYQTEVIPFWDGGESAKEYSTTSREQRQKVLIHSGGAVPFVETRVVQLCWYDLLQFAGGPFDFVNIDVEGCNLEVLIAMPFLSVCPQMVCIEIDPDEDLPKMQHKLANAGLKKQERIGGNLLAWR